MKILITTGIFPPEIGGPASYAPKLALWLMVTRGHEVRVVTYSASQIRWPRYYDPDKSYPFPVERIIRTNKLSNYFRFFCAVLRNARHADLIYSLDWFSAGLPVALAARLCRKKYILRVGGGYIWEKYLNEGNPPLPLRDFYERGLHKKYPFMYRAMRFVFRHAEKVVFNSDIQRELYIRHYGLSSAQTVVVYNPVPSSIYPVLSREPEKEIIFAGRMIVKNNLDTILRAFASARLADYKLTFIGDGFITEKLSALASSLGLDCQTSFIRSMQQEALYARIRNCRYVILPSWTDVSPNTAYECLALGIPFLLTTENYLSIRDQIPLMINPRSVEDMADKMRLLADEDAYKEYCAKLRAIEFKNDWNDVCEEHIKIFTSCLA